MIFWYFQQNSLFYLQANKKAYLAIDYVTLKYFYIKILNHYKKSVSVAEYTGKDLTQSHVSHVPLFLNNREVVIKLTLFQNKIHFEWKGETNSRRQSINSNQIESDQSENETKEINLLSCIKQLQSNFDQIRFDWNFFFAHSTLIFVKKLQVKNQVTKQKQTVDKLEFIKITS